MLESLFRSI